MKMYYPSNFGDISIEVEDCNIMLKTTELSLGEQEIVKGLIKKFKEDSVEDSALENALIKLDKIERKDIKKVHDFMKKKLKNNRPTITAIKFKDGKIELSEELENKDIDKGVTVEKPVKGCPAPEFLDSEVRAIKVLDEFLTKQQKLDFDIFRQFICTGNYTNHRYIITSRWSPGVTNYGQVYDLVEKKIICANCMQIPPSEEMLSLKLSIEYNEKEFLQL